MPLGQELREEIATIFRNLWETRDGVVVPSEDSIKLGNDAVELDATVLYADLADSTKLVDSNTNFVAAEFYKTFLHCAAKIVRKRGGEITAYDGDRIMGVFIGEFKNSRAVETALQIYYATEYIINPARPLYASSSMKLKAVVGIDTSKLFVANAGVRGAKDLVWVGRAANYAAKLSSLPDSYQTYITKEVYDAVVPQVKTSADGRAMWEPVYWDKFDNRIIYRSNWWMNVDYKPY